MSDEIKNDYNGWKAFKNSRPDFDEVVFLYPPDYEEFPGKYPERKLWIGTFQEVKIDKDGTGFVVMEHCNYMPVEVTGDYLWHERIKLPGEK